MTKRFEIDEGNNDFAVFDKVENKYVESNGKMLRFKSRQEAQNYINRFNDVMRWAKQEKII
jgi:hypothetical protein